MSYPFINNIGDDDDEDYEFLSILQEYDEQFTSTYQPSQSIQSQPPSIQPQLNQQPSQTQRVEVQKNTQEIPQKLVLVKAAFSQPQERRFAEVFEFDHFNPLQSRCFSTLYNKDINIVVSGKHYSTIQTSNSFSILTSFLFKHPLRAERQQFSR